MEGTALLPVAIKVTKAAAATATAVTEAAAATAIATKSLNMEGKKNSMPISIINAVGRFQWIINEVFQNRLPMIKMLLSRLRTQRLLLRPSMSRKVGKEAGEEREKEELAIQGSHMVSGTRCPAWSDQVK